MPFLMLKLKDANKSVYFVTRNLNLFTLNSNSKNKTDL